MPMRPAYLAGTWYPDAPGDCRRTIEGHARATASLQGAWRGSLAPHAGWRYSGPLAVASFANLQASRPNADLVVVFGSHRGPAGPNTVFRALGWETPLGAVRNATGLAAELARDLSLDEEPTHPAHADNGIEVLLPFVRYFYPEAEVLLVGVAASEVALTIGTEVGARCQAQGRDAVFVGSTDLTHYGPAYELTHQGPAALAVAWVRDVNDAGFLRLAISEATQAPKGMLEHARVHHSACCPGAAVAARQASAAFPPREAPALLGHTLSYDLAPSDNFVGYASVLF
jgi:AmmeMemoRadiSam system protein B